ncbi:hypothetical protein [Evansella clarkii]|uniref:hypothetical protein n=1 Tax=Evansella clarkii TaxID=79879 RepID=UPI00147503CF|nr:hypothetical protein [Evansella clarkii]
MQRKTAVTVSSSDSLAPENIRRDNSMHLRDEDPRSCGNARAENPFLTAFSRQKLVEAVPAERVRLKRESNNRVTI